MKEKEILLSNIDKIHTTRMGLDRIKNNLKLENSDIINWCINEIKSNKSLVTRAGKNYYVTLSDSILTINSYSFTIITAHKIK